MISRIDIFPVYLQLEGTSQHPPLDRLALMIPTVWFPWKILGCQYPLAIGRTLLQQSPLYLSHIRCILFVYNNQQWGGSPVHVNNTNMKFPPHWTHFNIKASSYAHASILTLHLGNTLKPCPELQVNASVERRNRDRRDIAFKLQCGVKSKFPSVGHLSVNIP